jgi:hypothetical protein
MGIGLTVPLCQRVALKMEETNIEEDALCGLERSSGLPPQEILVLWHLAAMRHQSSGGWLPSVQL